MGLKQKNEERQVVVVAVDARKEITDYALEWAVRNVIKATDTLVLLALLPPFNAVNQNKHSGIHHFLTGMLKKWGLHHAKEGLTHSTFADGADHELQKINNVCVQMIKQSFLANHVRQVETHVKIIVDAQMGCVAEQGEELGAFWIILDRRLKKQGDCCLKQLTCNVILIDHAIPKFLRLTNPQFQASAEFDVLVDGLPNKQMVEDMLDTFPMYRHPNSKNATPTSPSTFGLDSDSVNTDNSYSFSSLERDDARQTAPYVANCQPSKSSLHRNTEHLRLGPRASTVSQSTTSTSKSQKLKQVPKFNEEDGIVDKLKVHFGTNSERKQMEKPPKTSVPARRSTDSPKQWQWHLESPTKSNPLLKGRRSFDDNTRQWQGGKNAIRTRVSSSSCSSPTTKQIDRTSSIRKAISLSIKQPPEPPPLCSVCQHNAPVFSKPPRKFTYREMEVATDGFSGSNFLAEGGYGPVYRGVLPDGQVVAVKLHKSVSAQGASEFCSEVEVLSCAQHRNLVMLVGYCMEKEWLLVYEYACNGSLDQHLYGKKSKGVMAWHNRMKVAMGAARGLRYLHEDCRVGCIVHRDLRPNNILLTHDFKPMVGDFGLARWQADGVTAEETRIVGTLGYLAPEYTRTGQITEKADVYAFGVLLMELLSGLKAVDLSRRQGQQYLPDWAHPLLEKKMVNAMIDPRLEGNYVTKEVDCMMHAASLCLKSDPENRPGMSQVLRILEGDMFGDKVPQLPVQQAHTVLTQSTPWPKRKPSSNASASKMSVASISSEIHTGDHDKELQGNGQLDSSINENLVSEEFQAYLKGSLAEFIHKMKISGSDEKRKVNSGEDERTMVLC